MGRLAASLGPGAEPPDALINKGKLDSADLIIGAVQAHDIPAIADYAKMKKINLIVNLF